MGLTLAPGLDYDAWTAVGKRQSTQAGASMWRLGDWLAYGDANYRKTKWGDRVPDELYAQIAAKTGFSEGTLANAKWVCSALSLSRRREHLTFGHAQEFVGRCDAKDFDRWIGRVVDERLTIKALREQIRTSSAVHKPEANDTGTVTILEVFRQFVRDGLDALAKTKLTPALVAELLKTLKPVLVKLA